jgi:EmrB/QacA subfamily drug resistance transporter
MVDEVTAGRGRLGVLVQVGLLAGPFLAMVDSSVVNVAVPAIARSFGDPLSEVQWAVSGYLLALASGLAASAYLARRYGTRQVYLVSLVGFTLSSVACALAESTPWLVAARVAQGLLGAALTPLAMGMLFGGGGARRGISAAAGIVLFLPPALGPSLGGLLIAHFGWQSVFVVNVPFGVLGLVGVLRLRREEAPGPDASARFDPVGLLMLAAGLALSCYGASRGPEVGWWSHEALPFWSTGLCCLLGYLVWARGRAHPAVDLRLLGSRDSSVALGLSVIAALVLFAVLFLIPTYLQDVQGLSATTAGLVLLPQGVVMAIGTVLGDVLSRRHLVRTSAIAGTAVLTIATGALLLVEASTPPWQTALLLCGRGLALGLIIQPLLVATLAGLPPTSLADANTLFNVLDRVGGSFGVGLIATFFQVRLLTRTETVLGQVQPGSGPGLLGQVPSGAGTAAQTAATAAFHDTVWLLLAIGGLGFLLSLLLSPETVPSNVTDDIVPTQAQRS